jgi:hypothetical protein
MKKLSVLLLTSALWAQQGVNNGAIQQPGSGGSGNATTVNGATVPASQPCIGSNSSSQLIAGTGCGPTPALPAGVTFQAIYNFAQGTGSPTDSSGNGFNATATTGTTTWVNPPGLLMGASGVITYPAGACSSAKFVYVSFAPTANKTSTVATGIAAMWSDGNDWLGSESVLWNAPALAQTANFAIGQASERVATPVGSIAWSAPNAFYVNGRPTTSRIVSSLASFAASPTNCFIGGVTTAAGAGGLAGYTLYGIYVSGTALTAAQTAQVEIYDRYQRSLKGLNYSDFNHAGNVIIHDGDSITWGYTFMTGNFKTLGNSSTWEVLEAQDLGMGIPEYNLGIGGVTAATMVTNDTPILTELVGKYGGETPVVVIMAGVNDLIANTTAAAIQTSLTSLCTTVHSLGAKCIVSTILSTSFLSGAQLTARTTLNAGLISTWLAGGSVFDWITDIGNDPIMGTMGFQCCTIGLTWFDNESSKFIHPNAAGDAILAYESAHSILNVIDTGRPHKVKRQVPFQVLNALNGGTTTQTVNLLQLGPNEKVVALTERVTTAFTGTGLTTLGVTVGDSGTGGGATSYDATGLALASTGTHDPGAITFVSANGVVQANFTEVTGNLNALTAGEIDFDITTQVQP